MNKKSIIAVVLIVLLLAVSLVSCFANAKEDSTAPATSGTAGGETTAVPEVQGNYTDGVYTGTGTGNGGELTVEVTVEGGNIVKVALTQHSETPGIYENAEKGVGDEMIRTQKTDVDTVAGATYTSKGMIEAVKNALGEGSSSSAPASSSAAEAVVPEVQGSYKDGVYTGTGTGNGGELTVEVTVEGGNIVKVALTQHNETPGIYENAEKGVGDEIIRKQTADVDAIAGATHTSDGIIEAVKNALKDAAAE